MLLSPFYKWKTKAWRGNLPKKVSMNLQSKCFYSRVLNGDQMTRDSMYLMMTGDSMSMAV